MKCPKCGYKNRKGVESCGGCGQPLVAKRTCPQCGHGNPQGNRFCGKCGQSLVEVAPETLPPSPLPASFANGRYQVKKLLGEGGIKKVYLVHDTQLDRDVAFGLIQTEKLDDATRTRFMREARAMGRLGDHPNIITIHDMGEHEGQPYIVIPVMPGGDVEGLLEKAPERRLSIEQAIGIAKAICRGLEYAHGKGIIHRDIKPGNVYLSTGGTAKIGDFGLALAVDLPRLSQEGTMVGTYYYMPPEQAMGGKVTAKADLYSVGAMLYEMVTGQPPFIGDEPVAIIGQHINAPPVSPTWHRADLPPALEMLILQLLEKDPEKRPESAAVVLQALEAIEAGKIKKPSREAPAENPLYRRVFVGREPELKQLQAAFDGAISGQGTLMMVMGEPGIGKTALCEQLSTYVTLRGGRTMVGHCYEEGSLSLPYLAFVEALRSYVLTRKVKDLREELGTSASDVARIVSEIRERLQVKLRPRKDPEQERYRLLQAVTNFLRNAAKVKPTLVILEDLHDADKGTLEMLTHVSRSLAGTRLLIVGTYRDVEVDRGHPLSATLAELRRVFTYGRVLLRGLNADEVRRMLESITRESVPWGLAEAVHRQTEGNPLFVQEVVRYLVEEGLITRKEGGWRPTKDTPLEMSIPEGLRDVIGKRLSSLSRECNRLLSVAAVVGREFRLNTLREVAGIEEDRFVDALRDAVGLAILEERSQVGAIRYRFTHAFFRQTLYEEIIAPQRLQLHQQVARVLETQYANRPEEHAAELAEHFAQSTDRADLAKAVSYSEMAAERATAVYAWGETVRLLEQALKVQEVLDPYDKGKRCDLLVRFIRALVPVGQLRRILDEVAPEALSLAESINDRTRAAQVCSMVAQALTSAGTGGVLLYGTPEASQWLDRFDQYAESDTVDRAIADSARGAAKIFTGHIEEGFSFLNRSLELSRRLGDHETFWYTAAHWLWVIVGRSQYQEERLHLAEELAEMPRDGVRVGIIGLVLWNSGWVFMQWGQRERAEKAWHEHQDYAKRAGLPSSVISSIQSDALFATLDGRLEEAVEKVMDRMQAVGDEMDFSGFARVSRFIGIPAVDYLGMYDRVEEIMSTLLLARTPYVTGVRTAYIMAHTGRHTEAAGVLDQIVAALSDIGTVKDITPVYIDSIALQVSLLIGHREATELLFRQLSGIRMPIVVFFSYCVARLLGAAAAFLGRPEEARSYYDKALEVAEGVRHRPELALTRLQLAELLLEHYPEEKTEALEHLNFAIKEFRDMKMKPSLERALKHKEILGA